MKKILNAIGVFADLATDFAMGALLVIGGLAIMLGGATGTLWL